MLSFAHATTRKVNMERAVAASAPPSTKVTTTTATNPTEQLPRSFKTNTSTSTQRSVSTVVASAPPPSPPTPPASPLLASSTTTSSSSSSTGLRSVTQPRTLPRQDAAAHATTTTVQQEETTVPLDTNTFRMNDVEETKDAMLTRNASCSVHSVCMEEPPLSQRGLTLHAQTTFSNSTATDSVEVAWKNLHAFLQFQANMKLKLDKERRICMEASSTVIHGLMRYYHGDSVRQVIPVLKWSIHNAQIDFNKHARIIQGRGEVYIREHFAMLCRIGERLWLLYELYKPKTTTHVASDVSSLYHQLRNFLMEKCNQFSQLNLPFFLPSLRTC